MTELGDVFFWWFSARKAALAMVKINLPDCTRGIVDGSFAKFITDHFPHLFTAISQVSKIE